MLSVENMICINSKNSNSFSDMFQNLSISIPPTISINVVTPSTPKKRSRSVEQNDLKTPDKALRPENDAPPPAPRKRSRSVEQNDFKTPNKVLLPKNDVPPPTPRKKNRSQSIGQYDEYLIPLCFPEKYLLPPPFQRSNSVNIPLSSYNNYLLPNKSFPIMSYKEYLLMVDGI
jgi:hypothetical protein